MDAVAQVHLVVLVHGLWGNPTHLAELKKHILLRLSSDSQDRVKRTEANSEIYILVASSISDDATYDGIDWAGERVAREVMDKIRAIEADGRVVTKFSAIGYSLGGLVCRYLVGILYQKWLLSNDAKLSGEASAMKPINLITIATPHLGIPRYPGVLYSLFSIIGGRLLSRTGRQLYLADRWGDNDPSSPQEASDAKSLLEIMADPDQVFYKALSIFQNVAVYANAVNDIPVPYMTGAIESQDPFYADEAIYIEVELDKVYSPMLRSWKSIFEAPKKNKGSLIPPYIRYNFPHNIMIYPLLPLIAPLFVGLAVVRLGLASRKSRARIRALAEDPSFRDTLWRTVARLEREVEITAAKFNGLSTTGEIMQLEATAEVISTSTSVPTKPEDAKDVRRKPSLSDKQTAISRSLNELSNLRKCLVWIHPVRSSHAYIVCRDIESIPAQKIGEGVLRHVADHLLL